MRGAAHRIVGMVAVAASVSAVGWPSAGASAADSDGQGPVAVDLRRIPDPQVLLPDAGIGRPSGFGEPDIDGDLMVVSDNSDDTNGEEAGAADVYERSAEGWARVAKLLPDDARAGDRFGWSVAVSGETIVAVSLRYGGDGEETHSAVYVFDRIAGTWTQTARIDAPGSGDDDFFGRVAVDGDTIVVGAPATDFGATAGAGAAYVFARTDGTWSLQATLTGPARAEARFGSGVAVEGTTVLVGAPGADAGAEQAGAGYVFTRSGTTWNRAAKLTSPHPGVDGFMGGIVALDDGTAVLGNGTYPPKESCGVYVFVGAGATWTLQTEFACPTGGFGAGSIAIDGDTLAIGDRFHGSSPTYSSGAVYLSRRQSGTWTELVRLKAPRPIAVAEFGSSVALGAGTLAVAEYRAGNARVYVYDS